MGLIREPLDADFYFDPRLLTEQEREKISELIRVFKEKQEKKKKIKVYKADLASKQPKKSSKKKSVSGKKIAG